MTSSIAPFLQSMSFSDTIAGSGDSFSFNLADPEGLWMKKWKPKKGAELYAWSILNGFDGTTKNRKRVFGHFEIATVSIKGPPHNVTLTASSIPKGKGTKTKRTRLYTKATLKSLAQIIAKRLGLKLLYCANDNPSYDSIQQSKENDLVFLKRLCSEAGLSLKISARYLTILDDADLEAKESKETFSLSHPLLVEYSFDDTLTNIYNKCIVSYTDDKKKTHKVTFVPKNAPKGDTLYVDEEFKSPAAGIKIAKSRLREANKEMVKGTLKFAGLINRYAGATIKVYNFGSYDGKYIIVTVSGNIGTSGTETTLEIRQVLKGY